MTRCTRPVRRLTEAQRYSSGHKNIVVEIPIGGRLIGFRLAKTRRTYWLSTADCLTMAMRVALAADKVRKQAERKAKKGGVK